MERLPIPDVRVDEHTTQRAFIDAEAVREHAMEFYWRLKAYEDTSLSPEDCAEYKKFEDEIIASGKTFGRLIELLEADKDGRVVVLPCKVGDKVWFETYKNSARDFIGVQPHEVARISVDIIVPGEIVDTGFPADQVGRTVFLTKEEAEKALAEMEGKA